MGVGVLVQFGCVAVSAVQVSELSPLLFLLANEICISLLHLFSVAR